MDARQEAEIPPLFLDVGYIFLKGKNADLFCAKNSLFEVLIEE